MEDGIYFNLTVNYVELIWNNNKIQSFKSIFQKKYNKLINDIKEDKLETRRVYETDKENNLTNSNFDIFGSIQISIH